MTFSTNKKIESAYQVLIIIGAPRSGTNILRDVLSSLPGYGTWPCDEINYIWRHGNRNHQSDELDPQLATPRVSYYLRKQFGHLASKNNLNIVVEKTCANSLRIPFIEKIFPQAKYIFIYRNGFDVVSSAMDRWHASLDIPYLIKKARYVPFSDLPFYTLRYLKNRFYRVFSGRSRLAFWGPQFQGIDSALQQMSLEEVCALQWKHCVEAASDALMHIPKNKVAMLSYEDFVLEPEVRLHQALMEIDMPIDEASLKDAARKVSTSSIGKGAANLGIDEMSNIRSRIGNTLTKLGYE